MMTQRKPTTVGEMLPEDFLGPLGMNQSALAHQMGVAVINEIRNDKCSLTAEPATMLARVLGNSADFWLNLQHLAAHA